MKNSEAILVTPKHFEIQECPMPEPKDNEILMKVEYVGMCGSDIHGFEFGPFIPPKDPNQKIGLGHEVAGEVVKVGAKVTKFKPGDKVLIEPGVPDDSCEYCREGRYNICPAVDFMATQPNYKGALCQYMTHPEEWTYHVPEGMTTMEAALVEPAAVGMHAAILGEARLGKSIVILGAGTIGLMVLQACLSLGATDITVVDVMQKRLDLALKLGAKRVINGKEQNTVEVLRSEELYGDHGVELVFECAGAVFTAQHNWEAHVGDVLHKTYMKMYEQGTEAAAVTAVMVECTMAAMPVAREVKQVYLDRPFAFLIRDTQSGQVVFCGVMERV